MINRELEDILKPMVNDRRFPNIDRMPNLNFVASIKEIEGGKGVEIPGGTYVSVSSFIPYIAYDISVSRRFFGWKVQIFSKIVSSYLIRKLKMSEPKYGDKELEECRKLDSFYKFLKRQYGEWYTLPVEKIKELYTEFTLK